MEGDKKKKLYSLPEYYALEKQSERKSEYYAGEILAMAGASYPHVTISGNLHVQMAMGLQETSCRAHQSGLMVRIQSWDFNTYPDLSVICGPPEFAEDKKVAVTNPILIVEVLSKSTAVRDRVDKFEMYGYLESLRQYVLVEQERKLVEMYTRNSYDGEWRYSRYTQDDETANFTAVGLSIAIDKIYDGVDFPEGGAGRLLNLRN